MGLEILETAGDFDAPPVVAKVSANFTHYCRYRKGKEICTAVDIETIDGIDQANSGNLDEVLVRLSAISEAARDVIGQRQSPLDDRLALTPERSGLFIHRLETM